MTTCDVSGCKERAQRVTIAQVAPTLNNLFSTDLCQRHVDQAKRAIADALVEMLGKSDAPKEG